MEALHVDTALMFGTFEMLYQVFEGISRLHLAEQLGETVEEGAQLGLLDVCLGGGAISHLLGFVHNATVRFISSELWLEIPQNLLTPTQ